jgi:hypothetical protein
MTIAGDFSCNIGRYGLWGPRRHSEPQEGALAVAAGEDGTAASTFMHICGGMKLPHGNAALLVIGPTAQFRACLPRT